MNVNVTDDLNVQFEKTVRDLHRHVFHDGIDALKKEGIIRLDSELLTTIKTSSSAFRRFIRGCHYGFDLAQKGIGRAVCEREIRIRQLTSQLKSARRTRDKSVESNILAQINVLKRQQVLLRRLADAILAHLVIEEPWMLRRMQTADEIQRIDPTVLERTIQIASDLNREDRSAFHLASDVTTAVQIGDLIRLSFDEGPKKWEVIELKEGKVNEIIGEILDEQPTKQQSDAVSKVEEKMGEKAAAQMRRMLRQRSREQEIEKFRTLDHGIDPKHQIPLYLTKDVVIVDDYGKAILNACSTARAEGLGVVTINGCLNLMATSDEVYVELGKQGVAHSFFHLKEKKCRLDDQEGAVQEIRAMDNISPFYDLCAMNLGAKWPKPFFMWPLPEEAIFDLAFGRTRLFAQLDMEEFFILAKGHGIMLQWTTEASPNLGHQPIIPGSPNARALIASVPEHPDWPPRKILMGFLGRIFLELMPPRQLLDVLLSDFRNRPAPPSYPSIS